MRHEPSGSRLPLQPAADQRCRYHQAAQPVNGFHAQVGTPAGCTSRSRRAAVACRRQQRNLGQVARRAEDSYRALLAQYALQGSGDDAS